MTDRGSSRIPTSEALIALRLLLGFVSSLGFCFFLIQQRLRLASIPAWLAGSLADLTAAMVVLFIAGEAFFFHRDRHLGWWLKHFVLGSIAALLLFAISFLVAGFALNPFEPRGGEFSGFAVVFDAVFVAIVLTLVLLALFALLLRRWERYPARRLESLSLAFAAFLGPACLPWVLTGNMAAVSGHLVNLAHGRTRAGDTKLIVAAERGDIQKAQRLIEGGADVNEGNRQGQTALHRASACGQTAMVEMLLRHRASVDARDVSLHTPLMHGVGYGSLEADPESLEVSEHGGKYIPRCRPSGSTEIVRELVRAGADVNARDRNGMTALMHAADAGFPDVVRELLKDGADPSALTIDDRTALWFARRPGNEEVVNLLLHAGLQH